MVVEVDEEDSIVSALAVDDLLLPASTIICSFPTFEAGTDHTVIAVHRDQ